MSLFLILAAVTILSAVAFVMLRKSAKPLPKPVTEAEPLGYESAPAPLEVVKPAKQVKKRASRNTAKPEALAKMEAKPVKKVTKKTK